MKEFNNSKKAKLPIITERFLTVILKVLGSKTEMSQQELSNILRLLDSIDRSYYEDYDTTLGALIKAIEILASFKIKNAENIKEYSSQTLLVEIESELSNQYYTETVENLIIPTLTDAENKKFAYDAEFINSEIHTYLQYSNIIGHRDDLVSIANNISTSSGTDLREELERFRLMLNTLTDFYQEIELDTLQNRIIYGANPNFFTELKGSYDKAKSPSYVLKTGLQLFNACLSERNGVVPGYYLFYANINSFKSGLLEHFVKWLYLYNSDTFKRIKKKTGKKPILVYCSLENSKQDDFERFTKIYTEKDIHNFSTFKDLEDAWKSSIENLSGLQFEELNELIDIAYYYPINPIRVSDLDNIIRRLIEQNYIPVGIIVDYLEKLRNEVEDMKKGDNYLLGKISEDLFNISKKYDCALISAHQINREGARTLNNNKDSGKQNAMTSLNSTYIGKDWDIDKPTSFSGFIDIETDPETGTKYLTFKKGKQRGKRTSIETWVHPLTEGFLLEDDIKLNKPIGKLAMTPPKCDDLAFHISNKEKTNGSRGRINLNNEKNIDSENGNKIQQTYNNKNNSISLKETAKELLNMAAGVGVNIISEALSSILCQKIGIEERFDNKRLMQDKNGRKFIKSSAVTIDDRMKIK